MPVYAIIDLGTNTFNLLIAAGDKNGFRKIFGTKEVVKLGEGGITQNVIGDIPFQRGINALYQHLLRIKEYKADKIFAFATSAIRDAKNGHLFSEAATKKTGIKINIISGDKEAELICYGVRQAVPLHNEMVLIMDIGGGSTEFIIANQNEILWKQSFQLGVSRLLEKFKPSDPIKKTEIKIVREYIETALAPLMGAIDKFRQQGIIVHELIGSSGSFDSFADMVVHRFYSKKILKGKTTFELKLDELALIHKKILKSNIDERLNMKGLVPFRADNIVLSSILTQWVIEKLEISKVRLSKYALKEGVLWAILNDISI